MEKWKSSCKNYKSLARIHPPITVSADYNLCVICHLSGLCIYVFYSCVYEYLFYESFVYRCTCIWKCLYPCVYMTVDARGQPCTSYSGSPSTSFETRPTKHRLCKTVWKWRQWIIHFPLHKPPTTVLKAWYIAQHFLCGFWG